MLIRWVMCHAYSVGSRAFVVGLLLWANVGNRLFGASAPESGSIRVTSPDGRVAVSFHVDSAGSPRYSLTYGGKSVLLESRLGLVRDDANFTTGLKFAGEEPAKSIHDHYELVTAKRRVNDYRARQKVIHLQTASTGKKLDLVFQLSNDGVAFRYEFPEKDSVVHEIKEEATSFHFPAEARAWLQPIAEAKSGWSQANPSYEEYYEKDVVVGSSCPTGAGWVYPALFRSEDTWVLISEASLGRSYCGTRLRPSAPDGEYTIGLADPRETIPGLPANPQSTLPWVTPWRIVVVGTLKTIAESTLGIDVAEKPAAGAKRLAEPGKASWSWPLLGDQQTTYDVQKRFIDYAAEMGWGYTLIDAYWDHQIGYDKVKELATYARGKGVKIIVWYNSAGNWNTAPQTPRDRLLTHESRTKEFERLKSMGIAGLKVDFFGGDGWPMIRYYRDLLDDAAPYGFAMNFHGATLPRGLQRTYPNLMTAEAIRGLEYCTFEQKNADQEPTHAAMLPFTRNVFDPMDFTPMVLDQIPKIQRRTTSAFELALSVLFTSGVQHYPETPEGLAKSPDYVREFLKHVPSIWDDVRFFDGYPGKFVALGRRAGSRWWIAGVNAEDSAKTVSLDLSTLRAGTAATLITDGDGGNLSFRQETFHVERNKPRELTIAPHGGFVIVVE